MQTGTSTWPESLGYLPAPVRMEIEQPGEWEQHFIRWLLQTFENNLHLAERAIDQSRFLFDPERVRLFAEMVCPATLSARDVVSIEGYVHRLNDPADPVSMYIRGELSKETNDLLTAYQSASAPPSFVETLVRELNENIILGKPPYQTEKPFFDPQRFEQVKFSERTKALRRQNPQGPALACFNRLLIEDAYPREIAALPETSLATSENWLAGYLRRLASWLVLDLDRFWAGGFEQQAGSAAAVRHAWEAGGFHARTCEMIADAATFYRRRGTPKGLQDALERLCGWDSEIVERSWPRGMEIGVRSTVEGDMCLEEHTRLDECFVLLLRLNPQDNEIVRGLGTRIVVTDLRGSEENRRVMWLLDEQETGGWEEMEENRRMFRHRLQLVRKVVDDWAPAHLKCFLGIQASDEQESAACEPMVIGVRSVIEHCYINSN